ncbi:MAG: phospholipid/cholesterol/gamma-HCH transport system substrate-binding protein [Solirubrobacteraceae bacterium]|nr:phospholipid/cholesterol/gamma-HCH transport system substrate-binding protein [Solirubrobacteraceae bacterium]
MRRRSDNRLRALMDDTLLVGLVLLAIAGIAVVVSYRAQNGLPFASVYRVHADVPDGAKLLKNADVRIGGARVGQVLGIHAEPGVHGGPPFTRLDLALHGDIRPLPADTSAEVRLASVLGGKFLDLVPGRRGPGVATVPEDGVIALAHAKPGIDTDEALQVFGPQSRIAIRALISQFADGLAGRGSSINAAIETTARSLPSAERVLRVLVARRTNLPGFVQGAAAAASAVAPVAAQLGVVIDDTATTLAAIDDAGAALDQVLGEMPPTEAAATTALHTLRPVLADAAAVTRSLAPAGAILGDSLQRVDSALRTAAPVTTRVGRLAGPMGAALDAVDGFAGNPAALGAIQALKGEDLATFGGSAFVGLGAILSTTSSAQLHCNATALWMRNLASIASEGDSGGNWLRMIPIFAQSQTTHAATVDPGLHANYYPHENAKECEAGNEPFPSGQVLGNPPGLQSTHVEKTTQTEGGR